MTDMEEGQKTTDITLHNIPVEAVEEFKKITKRYIGNSYKPAFLELLERFHLSNIIAQLFDEIEGLRQRIEDLESKPKPVKTMRGVIG